MSRNPTDQELIRLLTEFGDSWQLPVSSACQNAFGQVMSFQVPRLVIGAVKNGLLEIADGEGPLVDSKLIYCRELRLTDSGRKLVNLEPWPEVKPVGDEIKPAGKKSERTLF